jgi:hypothetical protein
MRVFMLRHLKLNSAMSSAVKIEVCNFPPTNIEYVKDTSDVKEQWTLNHGYAFVRLKTKIIMIIIVIILSKKSKIK